MTLTVLSSPIQEFFEDKNKLLLSMPIFNGEFGDFYSEVWFWRDTKGAKTRLDWAIFNLRNFQLSECPQLIINNKKYNLSTQEYAKLFVLALMNDAQVSPGALFQMIRHLIAFLNFNKTSILSSVQLKPFWSSFLTESVSQKGFSNRLTAPSYRGAIKCVPLIRARNTLTSWGITGVISLKVTKRRVDQALDEACRALIGISISEYKEGGSFNYLGLELGQYYVDYLRQVYYQDYLYSLVCKKTIKEVLDKFKFYVIKEPWNKRIALNVILAALQGKGFQQHRTEHILHHELYSATKEIAFNFYQIHFEKAMALNEICIEKLVLKLGLNSRFDAVETIRVLMLQKYHALEGHKEPNVVWENYLASLGKTFLDSKQLTAITVNNVYEMMQGVVLEEKQDEATFLNSLNSWVRCRPNPNSKQTYKSFIKELNQVNYAMTTLVVAWLGYRVSEFGFPLSCIQVAPNLDILDSSYVPFRFWLKWFVPKTNKMVKIDREITSQCYQIAAQLNDLFEINDDSPCLYEIVGVRIDRDKKNKSVGIIESKIRSNWGNFVNKYQPFIDVVRLEALSRKVIEELSEDEKKEYMLLNETYTLNSVRFDHLLKTAKKVKEDWKVLSVTSLEGAQSASLLRKSLEAFIHNGLIKNKQYKDVIENYLSDDTKSALRSGRITLDKKEMMDICNELREGRPYPSPHAFRHVWAESVLTRYRGNVGAVIRHQFCHLDSSFFMRYLRNKEAKVLMLGARQRYLNSIVEVLLEDTENIGRDYVGGFAVFTKKAKSLIKPLNERELRSLNEQISKRVIHYQSNKFADCIPREGAEHRAKCFRFGRMNPQDAKPEFCLICPNALITSGHVKGIWVTIQPMVIQCLNTHSMGFMVAEHLPTLKSAYKRIKDLRGSVKNIDFVDKILSTIADAINNVESKLEEDTLKYGY